MTNEQDQCKSFEEFRMAHEFGNQIDIFALGDTCKRNERNTNKKYKFKKYMRNGRFIWLLFFVIPLFDTEYNE